MIAHICQRWSSLSGVNQGLFGTCGPKFCSLHPLAHHSAMHIGKVAQTGGNADAEEWDEEEEEEEEVEEVEGDMKHCG